jgi:hypothetical protein
VFWSFIRGKAANNMISQLNLDLMMSFDIKVNLKFRKDWVASSNWDLILINLNLKIKA